MSRLVSKQEKIQIELHSFKESLGADKLIGLYDPNNLGRNCNQLFNNNDEVITLYLYQPPGVYNRGILRLVDKNKKHGWTIHWNSRYIDEFVVYLEQLFKEHRGRTVKIIRIADDTMRAKIEKFVQENREVNNV